jgi:predicted nucleic acid-binding protein
MQILLDTSVLIDLLRRRRGRSQWLAQLLRDGHRLSTSVLNIAEVFAGMRREEEARTKALLEALTCFEIPARIAEVGGKIKNGWARQGRTLTLVDTMIAAVALENDLALATDNYKDFPMPDLKLFPMPGSPDATW